MDKRLAIIGSGPAGYTAAIYAARAGINVTVYTGDNLGGQLTKTTVIENYPGFKNGIDGNELMQEMFEQTLKTGAVVDYGTITDVDFSAKPYKLHVDDESWIEYDAIIIATGAKSKMLGQDWEQEFFNNGVHTCATCDGWVYKGKEVSVVGGGDTACEDALYLSNICSKVNMIVRNSKMKASKVMQDKVIARDNIEIHWCKEIEAVNVSNYHNDEQNIEGITIVNSYAIEEEVYTAEIIETSAIFIAIGHKPNTDFLKGKVWLDDEGYIMGNNNIVCRPFHFSLKSDYLPGSRYPREINGVYHAGDVHDKVFRQAITSAGDGCKAALIAERYLSSLQDK